MSFGLRTAEIDPVGPSGRALGLRKQSFDPGRRLRSSWRAPNGIEKADSEPEGVDAETIAGEQKPKLPAGLEFPGQNHYLCRAKNQDRNITKKNKVFVCFS